MGIRKIGDGKPMAGRTSSAGGLQVGFAGEAARTPNLKVGYTKRKTTQPMGKGKIPGGTEKYTAQGAGTVGVMSKSANTGKALGGGSVAGNNAVSARGASGANPTGANNTRVAKAMNAVIQKKMSNTGQAQVTMKSPPKQPKAQGVGVTPPTTNWHKKLGFA